MYWSAQTIYTWANTGGLSPLNEDEINLDPTSTTRLINGASLDLPLSNRVKRLRPQLMHDDNTPMLQFLTYGDPSAPNKIWGEVETFDALVLHPFKPVLLSSAHKVTLPNNVGALLQLKSTAGRFLLNHHHSGWGDPDFDGTWTFEITNMCPHIAWIITPGIRIIQMIIGDLDAPTQLSYASTGRYQGQIDPQGPKDAVAFQQLSLYN